MITYHRETLTLRPPGHPDRSSSLNNLALAVYTRYEQSGRIEDLEDVITYHREALSLRPPGNPDRSSSLNNLALAVLTRYEQSSRIEDLEDVITYHREALTLRPPGHPDRSTSLNNLALAVRARYQQLGRIEDLEEVISYLREALTIHPPGHPDRSTSLNNLAIAILTRYERLGRIEDLEEVITYHREALSLRPPGHPDRSYSLNNLANVVIARYEQSGRMEDLEEAIAYHREALTLRPPGHLNRPSSLNNLANVVLARYMRLGGMEDLEEVITYHREALTLHPPGHPNHSISLNNLATAVLIHYDRSGRMEDLEEVITYHHEALTLRPPGHPDRSASLNNLANAVRARYRQFGRVEDLEDVITYHREALTLRPLGHPDRSSSLNNLALAILTHFEHSGRMEDLDDAIAYHREALTLRPLGHPHRSSALNNLANAVLTSYRQSGRIEDLEEVITYHRETLTLHPPGHPNYSSFLSNLASAVLYHYKQSSRVEDLEEVITYYHEALTLRPLGHPEHFSSLNNFAVAVLTRYERSGRVEDLDEAIKHHREALTLCPLGHPGRSSTLNNLALAVHARYEKLGMVEDFEESFLLREQAVNDLAASSMYRLTAAMDWAQQARYQHHNSVLRAYSMTLHLLERCLIFYPDIDSQQKFLATVHLDIDSQEKFLPIGRMQKSLASDAASAAIDADDLETAVELLEQGRAILWSKMKGYRYPLDPLRQVNRQLADALEKTSVQLERLAISSESGLMDHDRPKLEVQMQRNHILSVEWEKIIGQIREIDGFRNFLQAVPFPTLQTAAVEGPVILINISNYRSDAIVIHINKPPTLVTLPNVQPEHLAHLGEQLALARQPNTPKCSTLILPILRDLWNDIVSPVCNHLRQLGVPQESHIWWCPTSKLCALPLHAAGLYESRKQNFNLPDIYISSYTPTLSALISARSNTVIGQSMVPKLLVIGQPDMESLPNVQDEINDIQQFGDFVDVLVGANASHEAVLHGLQQHSWAHFACHGHLGDNSQPFHASFELHNENHLTLLDLIQARLPNAEFAFLASCHSAAGDPNTPDETIHLAAALQFCGFRSVVGTLWELSDKAGPIVSKAFYKYMFRNLVNGADIRDSAKALSVAIRELRKHGAPLDCWIVLVHIGV